MSELRLPAIGFGTYKVEDKETIENAIKSGYRLFDTASFYNNHKIIGEALKESGKLRQDFYITSKLWYDVQTYDDVIEDYEKTCEELQVKYLDMYLIHWPMTKEINAEVWRAMEFLEKEGKVKSIGVSNFTIRHLQELLETAETIPMMNQVELHPLLIQKNLEDFCEEQGIALTAYGPFARGHLNDNEILNRIAKKHNKTNNQIILRWLFQREIFSIPKSSNLEHMKENLEVNDFKLKLEEINLINSINEGRKFYPDPENVYIDGITKI